MVSSQVSSKTQKMKENENFFPQKFFKPLASRIAPKKIERGPLSSQNGLFQLKIKKGTLRLKKILKNRSQKSKIILKGLLWSPHTFANIGIFWFSARLEPTNSCFSALATRLGNMRKPLGQEAVRRY